MLHPFFQDFNNDRSIDEAKADFFRLVKIKQRKNGFTVYVDEHTTDFRNNHEFYVVSTFSSLFELLQTLFYNSSKEDVEHNGYQDNFKINASSNDNFGSGEDNITTDIQISTGINGKLVRTFTETELIEEIEVNKD